VDLLAKVYDPQWMLCPIELRRYFGLMRRALGPTIAGLWSDVRLAATLTGRAARE